MSEQSPRDRELEALLDRDGKLIRAWRAASRDEPPPALDDAVRAGARRAVQAGPRRVLLGVRWRVPLSIAAVLVLSATLSLLVADRREHVPSAGVSEALAPAALPAADAVAPPPSESKGLTRAPGVPAGGSSTPRAGTAAASAPAERKREAETRVLPKTRAGEAVSASPPPPKQRSDGRGAAEEVSAGPMPEPRQQANSEAQPLRDGTPVERSLPSAPQAPMPTPGPYEDAAPASAPESLASSPSTTSRDAFPAQSPTVAEAGAKAHSESDTAQPGKAESVTSRAAMKVQEAAPLDARTWVERILLLRRQGKLKEAQQSLEAFRRRYPDYPVPPELAPAAR